MEELVEGIKERADVAAEDKWNVEALYPDLKAWTEDFKRVCRPDEKLHWPEIGALKGTFKDSADNLKKFFAITFDLSRKLTNLYVWAHMRYDENLTDEDYKAANHRIGSLYHEFIQEISWAEPEILSLSESTLNAYLKAETLASYHFYLERIVRLKPHTLSSEQEHLLALSGKALGTAGSCFSAFNNADLKFPKVKDEQGKELEMTHAKYMLYMRSRDRVLRKNAFETLHASFLSFENMITELLSGHVQAHLFHTKARSYKSCLESSLFPNQIDPAVYHNLLLSVRNHIDVLHRYMHLRKKVMKVDTLHLYDVHVPLVESVDFKFSYDQAVNLVIESVAPLGSEYQSILKKGLVEERWVDRYENKGKRSGAYSSGSYDSFPYILMNFQGAFHDLMTLAHEAGHSMHSYYTHKNQPYHYGDYSIFLAEVASTFNEELMFHHFMQQDLTTEEKAYLLNQKIEDIRSTFFRQVMFAEFELAIHSLAEKNHPLTPGLLRDIFHDLNLYYFGPALTIDRPIDIEWARIPHFYSNFYVYQYATGISAAHALFEKVTKGGEKDRNAYIKFLSSGSSDYPLDLLRQAGVNMREEEPIVATLKYFDYLVGELSKLIS